MDLPLANVSLGEVERQLQRLDYEIALHEATQDRIFEVMEQQSLNTEAEEAEDGESRAEQVKIRSCLTVLESAARAHALGKEIRAGINSLASSATLHGRHVKGQLDHVIEQMSQLYTLCSEAEEFERVQSLVSELQADVDRINKRFAEDEPKVTSESTLSEKSVISYRDPVRLPHLELSSFEGDPLTWKTFWEEFQCVLDKAPHLDNSDRLRYLKSAVKAKEALSIIDTTSIDEDAYDDVIEQLQQRYD